MISPDEVRHGDLIAWLSAGGLRARLAQALVIATDLDDQPLADSIRDLVRSHRTRTVDQRPRHHPEVTPAERDRLDAQYLDRGDLEQEVERQVQYWLTRYHKVLGRTVNL